MKATSRRFARASLVVAPLAIGALVMASGAATGAVSAAPPRPPRGQVTIYSETFNVLERFPDTDAVQQQRYHSGAGSSPNRFTYAGSEAGGHDAFFNTPDLTIGAEPMSVVSADVCLTVGGSPEANLNTGAYIYFGVQDKARNVAIYLDPDTGAPPFVQAGYNNCRLMTFPNPVKLVNRPHLLVVVELGLEPGIEANVDGVSYTLQPTQAGDVAPGAVTASVPNWFQPR